jgi:hypothetical protein
MLSAMSANRSLRSPVWKLMFELATGTAAALFIANRVSPKYVPWYWAVVVICFAAFAFAMWMHDAGYVTFVARRIDDSRAKKVEELRAIVEAETRQTVGAANSLWTTSHAMTTWANGYTVGIWLTPPISSQGQIIGVVNAACRVRHVQHGEYRATQGAANGNMGLSVAFPQEFQPLSNSPALGWPLREGEYQIDWTGMPDYATRQRFNIDQNGRIV